MIYLVKSKPDVFWWYIRDKPFELVWKPSLSTLVTRLQEVDFFNDEERIFVVVPDGITELSSLSKVRCSESNICYILIADVNGELEKSAEKLYKSLVGGHIKQLDLSNWKWWEEEDIAKRLNKYPVETRQRFIEDLPCPQRLDWQLSQPNPLSYEVADNDSNDVINLVASLGTPESLEKWESIPDDMFYRLFPPDLSQGAMYQILAGGGKRYGLCPALWLYLNMCIGRLLKVYKGYPQAVTKLFAIWVLCSTKWATPKRKGFTTTERRQRVFYNFLPSPESIEVLLDLTRNPIVPISNLTNND